MSRISNREVRAKVEGLEEFMTNNKTLYAYWRGTDANRRYCVFSYRDRWPIIIYVPQLFTWFENETKYSYTTSRHMTHARPSGVTTTKLRYDRMAMIANIGHIEAVLYDIERAAA